MRGFAVALFLLTAATARSASADVATAEALFREGRALLDQGRASEACQMLAESQRLDPSPGTLLNLADCHAQLGQAATAWAEFLATERLARARGRTELADEARRRAAETEPSVSYVTVRVAARVPGLIVVRDGTRLSEAAIGTALPIDPGQHSIQVSAPGYENWSANLAIAGPAERRVLDVPPLSRAKKPAEPPVPPAPARPRPDASLPASFWVAGATSVGAVGIGSVFGVLSLDSYADAESSCPTRADCSDSAIDRRDRAEERANVANAAFGTALLAAAVTGVIYLTSE